MIRCIENRHWGISTTEFKKKRKRNTQIRDSNMIVNERPLANNVRAVHNPKFKTGQYVYNSKKEIKTVQFSVLFWNLFRLAINDQVFESACYVLFLLCPECFLAANWTDKEAPALTPYWWWVYRSQKHIQPLYWKTACIVDLEQQTKSNKLAYFWSNNLLC